MIDDILCEKIDAYIMGQLTVGEVRELELLINTNSKVKEQFEIQRISHLAMERLRTNDLKKKFAEWEGQHEHKLKFGIENKIDKTIKFKYKWLAPAIAASVICTVITASLLYWFKKTDDVTQTIVATKPKNNLDSIRKAGQIATLDSTKHINASKSPVNKKQNQISDYKSIANLAFVEEDFNQTLMGMQEDEKNNPYIEAVKLYQATKYKDVLKILEKQIAGNEQEYLYLRGYTYYKLKEYQKAINDFKQFRQFKISDRKIDAIWCEVFCLIPLMPESNVALSKVLNEIISDPNNTYNQKAKKVQAELNL
jgi:tetratricopeptide (TPR) repeat protein